MKRHTTSLAIAMGAAAFLVRSFADETRLSAQITGHTAAPTSIRTSVPAPAPRMPNGKPDLQGVWDRPYVPDVTRDGRGQKGYAELPFTPSDEQGVRDDLRKRGEYGDLPYTPAGLQAWKSYDVTSLNDPSGPGDYTGSCFPFGLSRSMNSPYPLQIMQNDRYISLLFEQNTWFHVVYLDGRDHPKADAIDPTWFGHSIGRWEGDALVIDTVGFNGFTRLDTMGHPHSDQLHLVQTLLRTDADHIAFTITVDDPKIYAKPWKNERTFTLGKTELLEYSCEENNRSLWEGRLKLWLPPWATKK